MLYFTKRLHGRRLVPALMTLPRIKPGLHPEEGVCDTTTPQNLKGQTFLLMMWKGGDPGGFGADVLARPEMDAGIGVGIG